MGAGFQALAGSIGPSHAWVHAESFGGEVRVAGMTVRSDDLIHADRHGAIVIPIDIAAKIPDAAELCGRRETPILEIAAQQGLFARKAEGRAEAFSRDPPAGVASRPLLRIRGAWKPIDALDGLDGEIAFVAVSLSCLAGIAAAMRASARAFEYILEALPAKHQHRRRSAA